jgi:hypothetical protein
MPFPFETGTGSELRYRLGMKLIAGLLSTRAPQ